MDGENAMYRVEKRIGEWVTWFREECQIVVLNVMLFDFLKLTVFV